jgi:glycine/D-amino acid oxidase-like deaminating enzyme
MIEMYDVVMVWAGIGRLTMAYFLAQERFNTV